MPAPSVWGTARRLGGVGVHVFPVRPDSKGGEMPDGTSGQYLESWPAESTTDQAQIADWARRWPRANLAIHLGKSRLDGHRLIVIDIDQHPDGPDGLRAWVNLRVKYPGIRVDTARVFTPSGNGQHWYFTLPIGCDVGNLRATLAPGIDVRKGTGYVVCPPSTTLAGRYTWEPRGQIAELPNQLQMLLKTPKYTPSRASGATITAPSAYVRAAFQGAIDAVAQAPQGTRNATLFYQARGMGELIAATWAALDVTQVRAALLGAALTCGLPEAASGKTITSGFDKGFLKPRPAPRGRR